MLLIGLVVFSQLVVGQAYGILIDIREIGFLSVAGGEVEGKVYVGERAWEQEILLKPWKSLGECSERGGGRAPAGEVADLENFKRAQGLWFWENWEDVGVWSGWTAMYGERTGNGSYLVFSLLEPVDFTFSLVSPEGLGRRLG